MKKILFGIVALVVIVIGSGYAWYKVSYGGTEYYLQIKNDGKVVTGEKTYGGGKWKDYEYKIPAYTKDGKEKTLDFMGGHNLKHGAYLKVLNNNKKGVTSWEEVKKKDVPEKALSKITAN